MDNLSKYINPISWHEVLTEQEKLNAPVREIPVRGEYLKRMEWESDIQYNYRMYINENSENTKAKKAFLRIIKYGYPKRCPIINKISNLIIFELWVKK